MRQHLAHVAEELGEKPILDSGQVNRRSAAQDAAPREVDDHVAESHVRASFRASRVTAQERADSRDELGDPEWLREVVVGAGIERRHLVSLRGTRGQDDDRRLGPAPKIADEFNAVEVGEAEVQDDAIQLTLHALAKDHPEHGKQTKLTWRS